MNIIKRKSDNVVIFKGDYLVLDKNGCRGKGWEFNKIPSSELVLEKIDELPGGFVTGLCTYINGVWGKTAEATEIADKDMDAYADQAIVNIDNSSDDLVTALIGRRDTEYLMAEKQAQAYIDAKYKGETFPYVSSWAKAKNQTEKWAADNIIETANSWRSTQSDVREKRLAHKERIRLSETIEEINETLRSWYNYIDSVKLNLGVK
jgi:hypothetical protein